MVQFNSSGLVILSNRPPRKEGEEPVATKVNGRMIENEEERVIVTQGHADVRKREADMLAGLLR